MSLPYLCPLWNLTFIHAGTDVIILLGLDPAFPAFELAGPQNRIDKEDAELVDIIHTNSGFLWEVGINHTVHSCLAHIHIQQVRKIQSSDLKLFKYFRMSHILSKD